MLCMFLSQTHSDYYAHLLPFMLPEAQGDMATLYNQVKKNMTAFYKGSGSTTSLKQLAKEWSGICAMFNIHFSNVSGSQKSVVKPRVSNSPQLKHSAN